MRLKTKTPLQDLTVLSDKCHINPADPGWVRLGGHLIYVFHKPFSCWWISATNFWEITTQ